MSAKLDKTLLNLIKNSQKVKSSAHSESLKSPETNLLPFASHCGPNIFEILSKKSSFF
jgi:hypothetical protein